MHDLDTAPLLLDACALINLFACAYPAELLRGTGRTCAIVDRVQREALAIRRGGVDTDALERVPIDLQPLIVDGLLQVLVPTDDEYETFVELALALGDGEALTIAVAEQRGWAVVTDDRKAARIARERGRVSVVSSLALIQQWAITTAAPPETVRQALLDLRARGAYQPARTHPLYAWWAAAIAAAD